jgi:acyl-CoA synthetase (AMP-forming)/AMP-acid ligase II
VAQATAFAMPHDRLGEEVAAVVVLDEGASADERELKEFCSKYLADFKTPKTILIMADIPKGPTGKIQRVGLAEKLGLVPAKA